MKSSKLSKEHLKHVSMHSSMHRKQESTSTPLVDCLHVHYNIDNIGNIGNVGNAMYNPEEERKRLQWQHAQGQSHSDRQKTVALPPLTRVTDDSDSGSNCCSACPRFYRPTAAVIKSILDIHCESCHYRSVEGVRGTNKGERDSVV